MRAFVKLRELMASHKELREKIDAMEKKYDHQFKIVFDVCQIEDLARSRSPRLSPSAKPGQNSKEFWRTIKKLLDPPEKPRQPIGFHVG